jgi:ubiquinone/menaquinone biosynthesis C-methylase UbiE
MFKALALRFVGLFGKGMRVIDEQELRLEDPFRDGDRIIDLGGGGEGVIGLLRGKQVVAVDLRKDELDDTPDGPEKVVADARALPFADASFDAASAFFFLMYLRPEDRPAVLREAFRVLRPGGILHVWDVVIPEQGSSRKRLFVVPLKASIPSRTISTAYGVPWEGRAQDCDAVAALASSVGFAEKRREAAGQTFHLELLRR